MASIPAWNGVQRQDPFSEMLRQPISFADENERQSYLGALSAKLAWLREENCSAVIGDGLVGDSPIVAASDAFCSSTQLLLENIMYTDMCPLLNDLTVQGPMAEAPSSPKPSKSAYRKLRSYCELSRFPSAVTGGSGCQGKQMKILIDNQVITNNFIVFRVHVQGHPLLVGVQCFCSFSSLEELDRCPFSFTECEAVVERICNRLVADSDLKSLLRSHEPEISPGSGSVLYHGSKTSSTCLFYNGARSVLRQEPQTLSRLGVLHTESPLEKDKDGALSYFLRVETLVDWKEPQVMPMGFTRTPPTAAFPETLHLVPQTVGFTVVGPVNNDFDHIPTRKEQKCLKLWPQVSFPRELTCGDVVGVKLTAAGDLERYLNADLLHTVKTGRRPDEGVWHGAFEVSFDIARVSIDPFVEATETAKAASTGSFRTTSSFQDKAMGA